MIRPGAGRATARFGGIQQPRLFFAKQVAEVFGIAVSTLDQWVSEGKFIRPEKAARHGRAMNFWTQADIDKEKAKRGMK